MGLKHRIIPVLLTDGTHCVKPVSFERPYRRLGTMEQYIQVMERRNIDELFIIDIEATAQKRGPFFDKFRSYCNNLFCPVTYGGGIHTLDDICMALENGADKVAIKTSSHIINEAAQKFGAQAIVGVIDILEADGIFWAWHNNNPHEGAFSAWEYAKTLEKRGAGEILLNDIKRDGVMESYNLDLIANVSKAVNVPVVALGGCGEPAHMAAALAAGASAVAAGSMFLYTETTPKDCARYLETNGVSVRV